MTTKTIVKVLRLLEDEIEQKQYLKPMVAQLIHKYGRDPFLILISCLLSLRSRDVVTQPVTEELFRHISTPEELCAMPLADIEQIIRSIGFRKRKAETIRHVSCELINRFHSKVPHSYDQLISLKGVGPKTANLVLAEAWNTPAICVDTHVHRLSNHFGFVSTKTPEETQIALETKVPQEWWVKMNELLVGWGQNVCSPHKKHSPCKCQKFLRQHGLAVSDDK